MKLLLSFLHPSSLIPHPFVNDSVKAFAMNPAWAVCAQGVEMFARAVADVLDKIILGIDFVEGAHEGVTVGLGDDGRGGDGGRDGVAVNDCLLREVGFFKLKGVYQEIIGAGVEL